MNTRYRFSLPVCALFAAVFSFSAVPSGHAGVSDPLDVQVSNINSGGSYFAFVHLTDLHIGEGSADYGTPGYEDAPPAGDVGVPAQLLRKQVDWINANIDACNIDLVIVTGDITQSGERSEFMKAREILDTLTVPYVPILGNHDVWPYTGSTEAPYPFGDQYFKEVFASTFNNLQSVMPGWNNGTRLTRVWNPEAGCYSWFQNFSFTYGSYHFMCSDFVTRGHALSGSGANPEADLHNFTGGTWPWFRSRYDSYPHENRDDILIFAHHPMTKDPCNDIYSFSYGEYNTVASFLNNDSHKYNTGLWNAGHMHRNYTYNVRTLGFPPSTICPGFETTAAKDGGGHLRIIKVWNASF